VTALLQEYVARRAEARPDAVALVMGAERMTYGELEAASNRLARLLREAGCRCGDRVCLFLPKSIPAIVAEIAILKADCAYVPIDTASPAPRVEKIVQAAEPALLLVTAPAAKLLDEVLALGGVGDVPVGSLDARREGARFSAADVEGESAEPRAWENSGTDPAHLLFTSGSTGTPKGVVIKHENVIAFVEWATRFFGTSADDRISGHPPLHFDLSTFDIYGTFLAGGELHLVPPAANLLPHKLAELIRDSELTQWFSVPSVLTYMAKLDVIAPGDFPTLRRVLWCGEVLPTPILIHWMERLPHATFTNLYGPTEATIASSYHTVGEIPSSETDPIPIGVACDGEELLVLDERFQAVPSGEIGDLYIGGVGLSPGYWRDEEKTRAAFVPDPRSPGPDARIYRTGDLAKVTDDGLVHFLGRADSQIKSRGYRIELGEIETALNALEAIRECAVVGVDTGGFEGTTICCAYAPAVGGEAEPPEVRERLRKVLPSYMLPARWLVLEALPKNVNGKIDRRTIREHFEHEAAAPAAVSERVAPPRSAREMAQVSTGHFRRPAHKQAGSRAKPPTPCGGSASAAAAGEPDDGTASGA
jgi:amino acid adenylation domain-containing protein